MDLAAGYAPLDGKVQIGVRPEFIHLGTGSAGLPVQIARVEDVGRHKIVRASLHGQEINLIAAEGAEIAADMNRVVFNPAGINGYRNDWCVAP